MRKQAEETEQRYICPYCWERGSFIVDLTEEGEQRFVQDCEVCCNPIEFALTVENGEVGRFSAEAAQQSG